MSKNLNSVRLIGNVGQKPVSFNTKQERQIVSFSIATTDKFKGGQERTDWHRCYCSIPEINVKLLKELGKGDLIQIEGALRNFNRELKNGQNFTYSKVEVMNFIIISKKVL